VKVPDADAPASGPDVAVTVKPYVIGVAVTVNGMSAKYDKANNPSTARQVLI